MVTRYWCQRILPLLVVAIVLVCGGVRCVEAMEPAPVPVRAAAYLVKKDGVFLWAQQEEDRLPPASLTKIMTALLALERGGLERVVTVSEEAAAETGSQIGLRAGDQLRLYDLLCATLIKSANDACHVVAEAVAGDTERFISLMNARAASLNLRNTHYSDVCGHDHPDHYSSARDLAVLAELAMRNPIFARIVATETLRIRTVNGKRTFVLRSSNRLIGALPEVMGVKTGYTEGAGRCLIAMAERSGSRVLLVLLNDRRRWSEAPLLFDKAFASVPVLGRQDREVSANIGSRM